MEDEHKHNWKYVNTVYRFSPTIGVTSTEAFAIVCCERCGKVKETKIEAEGRIFR